MQANAALVETRNAGVGQVVENARILELPLNGRQVVELIALAGAAAPAPHGQWVRAGIHLPKGMFPWRGGLNYRIEFHSGRCISQQSADNGYMSMPFPDALQEFKVETSATSAAGAA